MFSGGIKWEHWLLAVVNIPFKINPSVVNFPVLYLLKTQENQGFSVDLPFCPYNNLPFVKKNGLQCMNVKLKIC